VANITTLTTKLIRELDETDPNSDMTYWRGQFPYTSLLRK